MKMIPSPVWLFIQFARCVHTDYPRSSILIQRYLVSMRETSGDVNTLFFKSKAKA